MNKTKILEFFSHKTWLWQRVFRNFYVGRHQLFDVLEKTDLQLSTIVRLCRNVDDLDDLWELAQKIDFYEEEIIGTIEDLRYCRPIPWQYDFLDIVSKSTEMPFEPSLNLESIIDAYCAAVIEKDFKLGNLIKKLDADYRRLYASAANKEKLVKRNLSLVLDATCAHRFGENTAIMNSRELVDRYLPVCGIKGLAETLKTARTSELKLSPEERACLGFSYYSPFFCDEIEMRKQIPGSTIFSCVEEQLKNEQDHNRALHEALSKIKDEDEEDEIRDLLDQHHHFLFVDPMDRCLLDIRIGDVLYANVYVQKFPKDDLNNSLPDFIRLHKGFLYTVEFVEDISQLEIAQDFLQHTNAIKRALLQMEKAFVSNPLLSWQPQLQHQYQKLEGELAKCYHIYCKM